jgi:hypothetical protein
MKLVNRNCIDWDEHLLIMLFFIHDYVKGCNGGYTIPTNVWFAPTNANKICFAISHRGTMGCKPNMGIDKSIT